MRTALQTITAHLDVRDNQLSASLPTTLDNVANLTWLDLSFNLLTGSISSSLFELKGLQYLSLAVNMMNGTLLPDIIEPGALLGKWQLRFVRFLCTEYFLTSLVFVLIFCDIVMW
jgi:hypothetical protein